MYLARDRNNSAPAVRRFQVGASVVKGQPVRWVAGGAGTVTDPASATSCPDCVGVTLHAATYSTVRTDTAGVVEVWDSPTAVFAARVAPGATADAAFADGDGCYLTNTSASSGGTVITDADVTTTADAFIDGYAYCLSGANAGSKRIITAHTASTSVTVTVPFDNAIAVGDTFLVSAFAEGVIKVQLTTNFTGANGTIAGGTGAEFVVEEVRWNTRHSGFSKTNPLMEVLIMSEDHYLNKA